MVDAAAVLHSSKLRISSPLRFCIVVSFSQASLIRDFDHDDMTGSGRIAETIIGDVNGAVRPEGHARAKTKSCGDVCEVPVIFIADDLTRSRRGSAFVR